MAPASSHPPQSILAVAERIVRLVRSDPVVSHALDAYLVADPGRDNVRIRWLSRARGYEVVLLLDADALLEPPAQT